VVQVQLELPQQITVNRPTTLVCSHKAVLLGARLRLQLPLRTALELAVVASLLRRELLPLFLAQLLGIKLGELVAEREQPQLVPPRLLVVMQFLVAVEEGR
jgi:hypothetical protein